MIRCSFRRVVTKQFAFGIHPRAKNSGVFSDMNRLFGRPCSLLMERKSLLQAMMKLYVFGMSRRVNRFINSKGLKQHVFQWPFRQEENCLPQVAQMETLWFGR